MKQKDKEFLEKLYQSLERLRDKNIIANAYSGTADIEDLDGDVLMYFEEFLAEYYK